VVVALDLERDRLSLAQIDHACVLAGPLEHARPARGKPLEQARRVLVAAVLRPEEREDGELEIVRLALEQPCDPRKLPVREAEGAMQRLGGDLAQGAESIRAGRQRVRRTF
jgi:hypothetical protein